MKMTRVRTSGRVAVCFGFEERVVGVADFFEEALLLAALARSEAAAADRVVAGLFASPGSPWTAATAATTATAPETAAAVAQERRQRRCAAARVDRDGAPSRDRPSSRAQKPTPPYRLAATYRSA